MAAGIFLHRAHLVEELADHLAEVARGPLSSPFAREAIVVGSPGLDRWVVQQLARRLSVWAAPWVSTPRRFVDELFDACGVEGERPSQASTAWAIAEALPSVDDPDVARHLQGDDGERRLALACRLAELFEHYALFRPELLADEHWQGRLAKAIAHRGLHTEIERLLAHVEASGRGLPERVSVFGVSRMPPRVLDVLVALSRRVPVHVFVAGAFGEAHPLLASMGGEARAGLARVRACGPHETSSARVLDGTTALGALQSDLARDAASAHTWTEDDRSIELFSCHGPMREAETVRDRLLAIFAADPTLRARDVAILTPALDVYAPYLEAAFSVEEAKSLRLAIADGGGRPRASGGAALVEALHALTGRLAASEVLGLLGHPAVRARHGLDEDDVATIGGWLEALGVHWGADASHRRERGYATDAGVVLGEENTLRAAVDRLLLGFAMPGGDRRLFAGRLGYDDLEGSAAVVAGRFAELVEGLLAIRPRLAGIRTRQQWQQVLSTLVDLLLPDDGTLAFERRSLHRRLEAWWEGAQAFSTPLPLRALMPWIESVAIGDARGVGFAAHGITAAALLPMRNVPFRVVVLVGMGDRYFPRRGREDSLDRARIAPREEDRGAFLDALLAARDRLIVTWPGRDPQENLEVPPSVVVSELLDTLDATFGVDARKDRVVRAPLSPWDARRFRAGPLHSASTMFCDAAVAAMAASRVEPPFVAAKLAEEPVSALDVAELAQMLARPFETLLKRRLLLDLRDDAGSLEDDDPADLDGLATWALRDRVLRLLEDGCEQVRGVIRASGMLPPGALGELQLEAALRVSEELRARAAEERDGEALPPLLVDLSLASTRLVGTIAERFRAGRVVVRAAKASAEQRVHLWVRHLVLQASTRKRVRSTLVFVEKDVVRTMSFEPVEDPVGRLEDLVALYRAARRAPLPSFGDGSLEVARKLDDRAIDRLRDNLGWAAGDPWTLRALRGHSWVDFRLPEHPDALDVMRRLFVPMIEAEAAS